MPCILLLPGAWCYAVTFMMERALLGYMPAKEEAEKNDQGGVTDTWYYE